MFFTLPSEHILKVGDEICWFFNQQKILPQQGAIQELRGGIGFALQNIHYQLSNTGWHKSSFTQKMPSCLCSRKKLCDTLFFSPGFETQIHIPQWYAIFIKPVVDCPFLSDVDQVRRTVLENRTATALTVARYKTLGSVANCMNIKACDTQEDRLNECKKAFWKWFYETIANICINQKRKRTVLLRSLSEHSRSGCVE